MCLMLSRDINIREYLFETLADEYLDGSIQEDQTKPDFCLIIFFMKSQESQISVTISELNFLMVSN